MAGIQMLLLALSSIVCALGDISVESKLPSFCKGNECPRFTVIEKTMNYELRQYEPSTWVTTMEESVDLDASQGRMFPKLLGYLKGMNDKKKQIGMTVPVAIKINPGPGPACTNNFTMGFYLAPTEAMSPPKPTDASVKLATLPAQKFYTTSFGGHAEIEDFLMAAVKLKESLPAGAKVDKSHFYRAVYDDPRVESNRHNEVWYTVL